MRVGGTQSKIEYETTWQYETGVYHRFAEGIDSRLVLYFTDIKDYLAIDRPDIHNNNEIRGWNIDSVQFWGIEYEFNATFDQLNIFGNYTYLANDVKENDPDKLVGFWVELPPKHKINLSFRYRITDSLLFTWDQRYIGRRLSEAGLTLDEYTTSDAGIEYSFLQNKAKLTVYVNNLFGANYEQIYGYPMPRQLCGATLKYTFF